MEVATQRVVGSETELRCPPKRLRWCFAVRGRSAEGRRLLSPLVASRLHMQRAGARWRLGCSRVVLEREAGGGSQAITNTTVDSV